MGVLEQIDQTRPQGEAEPRRNRWLYDIGINQQYGTLQLHGDGHCKVDRGIGLAFARHRAGHHHNIPATNALARGPESVTQNRPLQNPELLCEGTATIVRDQQALPPHKREIERLCIRLSQSINIGGRNTLCRSIGDAGAG